MGHVEIVAASFAVRSWEAVMTVLRCISDVLSRTQPPSVPYLVLLVLEIMLTVRPFDLGTTVSSRCRRKTWSPEGRVSRASRRWRRMRDGQLSPWAAPWIVGAGSSYGDAELDLPRHTYSEVRTRMDSIASFHKSRETLRRGTILIRESIPS